MFSKVVVHCVKHVNDHSRMQHAMKQMLEEKKRDLQRTDAMCKCLCKGN